MTETAAKMPDLNNLLTNLDALPAESLSSSPGPAEADWSLSPLTQSLSSTLNSLVGSQEEASSSPASSTTSSIGSPEAVSSSEWRKSESKGSPKRRNAALKFPPCIICSGKASGLHYGCNTCEACKNFFRRYIIRKNGYVCAKENDCQISFTNKSNCSACRLAKCLVHGMCKSKSKLGRYSYNKRTETINIVKQLEHNNDKASNLSHQGKGESVVNTSTSSSTPVPGSSSSQNEELLPRSGEIDASKSNYDKDIVDKLTLAMDEIKVYDEQLGNEEVRNAKFKEHYEKFMLKVNMFGSMNAVSMEEYQTLLRQYGIDIDGQYEACCKLSGNYEVLVNQYCDYAKKMPGFSQLSYNDQSSLLKSTHCFAFIILMHQGYSEHYNVFLEVNGDAYHLDECADRIVSRQYVVETCKYFSHLQKLKLTKEEMSLLIAISTLSSDCCKLENPELVEKLQLDFVDLLSQYLYTVYERRSEATARFSKLLDCLVRIREPANIYYQELKGFKNDSLMMEAMPYMAHMIPEEHT